MDLSTLLANPPQHFDAPDAVVADARLSPRDRMRVLAAWEDRARRPAAEDALDEEGAARVLEQIGAARAALAGRAKTLRRGTRKLAGLFTSEDEANHTRTVLERTLGSGATATVIGPHDEVLVTDHPDGGAPAPLGSAAGAAAGAGTMGAGLAGLAAVDVFVAGPIALTLAGVGGILGSVAGAVGTSRLHDDDFVLLIEESQQAGHWLVVLEVSSESTALEAQSILARTDATETIDHGGTRRATGR